MVALLSGLLTLLTAAALLLLMLGPPAPSRDLGGLQPGAGAPSTLAAWARLAETVRHPELGWLGDLAGIATSAGLGLTDAKVRLASLPNGRDVVVALERLTVEPGANGNVARFRGHLGGDTGISVDGTLALDDGGVHARLRLETTTGLAELAGIEDVALTGGPIILDVARSGVGGPVSVTVASAGPLALRGPAMRAALPVDRLDAALVWHQDTDRLVVERLALGSPALRLDGRGDIAPERVTLALAFTDVDAAWAGDLWPDGVARGAREWVTTNIPQGQIERLDMHLDLDAAALTGDLEPSAIAGQARVSGAEIHYLRPMPPVTNARASATFDGNALSFEIEGGTLNGIEVQGGRVRIADYGSSSTVETLTTSIDAVGDVPTMLMVLDHEPLALSSRYGLPKEGSRGRGSFRVEVALPLLSDVALDDVDLAFAGDFTNTDLPGVVEGRSLSEAQLRLEATQDLVEARGQGRIEGVPLDFDFRLDTTTDEKVLNASGRVDGAGLASLGLPAGLPIAGPVDLTAAMRGAGETARTSVTLDLADAEVQIPVLAVWKPAAVPGTAQLDILERPAGTDVEQLTFNWPGVEVGARASFDPAGALQSLQVAPFRVAATELTVDASRTAEGLTVNVVGPRLDVSPLSNDDRPTRPMRTDDEASPPQDLRVTWAIDQVDNGGEARLLQVRGHARVGGGAVRHLEAQARTPASERGLDVLVVQGPDETLELSMTSADAGGALRALGFSDALHGGTLEANATLDLKTATTSGAGTLTARNLAVQGVPPIVRQLSAAPQIPDLGADALRVTTVDAPFSIDGSRLMLDDASIRAAQLAARVSGAIDLKTKALDLQGSLAPLASVNLFIGQLPLIGDLLQGRREAGAFAVSFAIKGTREEPEVTINPLTIVTPGLIQDLFAGGQLNPPRVPEN